MELATVKLFRRIGDYFADSQRKDYEKAFDRVAAALDSGKLRSTDKVTLGARIIDAGQPAVFSPLDGIDWVELNLLAEENKMPLVTIDDLCALLQFAIKKHDGRKSATNS